MEYYMGLDIGGTNLRVVVLEKTAKTICYQNVWRLKRKTNRQEEIEENIVKPIQKAINKINISVADIKVIGISCAANFSRSTGEIIRWRNNEKWSGFPLKGYLEQMFSIPICMEDDANCSAMGEMLLGSAKEIDNFIYITISTGIGGAIVFNHSIYTGIRGFAGEIGHIKVKNYKDLDGRSRSLCLQEIASGTTIQRKLEQRLRDKLGVEEKDLLLGEMIKKYSNYHKDIEYVFEEPVKVIAEMIEMLQQVFDMECYILGGGVCENDAYFFQPLKRRIKELDHNIKLKKGELGTYSGAFGALENAYRQRNGSYLQLR